MGRLQCEEWYRCPLSSLTITKNVWGPKANADFSLEVTGQYGQKVAGPEEATVRGNEVCGWWRKTLGLPSAALPAVPEAQ